jgi:putative peptidoglycan lipid II flippase
MTIPATIGLMILAEPIMSVLYQHGKFGARETAQAAGALRFYAVGLCSYAALKVLVNSFYAIDKRNVPMLVSFGAIAVNLVLGWLLTFRLGLGHRGLALSTGCVATLNFIVLYAVMRRHLGGIDTGALTGMLARMLGPAVVLAGVCVGAKLWLLADWATQPFAQKVGLLTATMIVAVAAFAGSALLFRIRELDAIAGAIKRRLVRARSR